MSSTPSRFAGLKDGVTVFACAALLLILAGGAVFLIAKVVDRHPNAGGIAEAHSLARQVEKLEKGQRTLPSAFVVANVVATANASGSMAGYNQLIVTPVGTPSATSESFNVDLQTTGIYGDEGDSQSCLTFVAGGRYFTDAGSC
jgi:hypothetical protein